MQEGQPGSVVTPGSASTKGTETSWQFHAEEPDSRPPAPGPAPKAGSDVSWTASEFVDHDKSSGWYMLLALSAIGLAAITYFFSHGDLISTAVVLVVFAAFGVFAARKPRQLEYNVNDQGIKIGEKFYPYSSFRSFSIVQEDALESIWLMPLKRFMPIISIYFDSDDGQKIIDVLGQALPIENREPDFVDKLMHRIRF